MDQESTENNQKAENQAEEINNDSKDDSERAFADSNLVGEMSLDDFKTSLLGFSDLKLSLRANMGSIKMPISQFLRITRGSIIELGRKKEDLVDVDINGKKVGEGEIVIESDYIGIEIQKVIKSKKI